VIYLLLLQAGQDGSLLSFSRRGDMFNVSMVSSWPVSGVPILSMTFKASAA